MENKKWLWIVVVAVLVLALIGSCGSNSGSSSGSKKGEVCGICGGGGVVTYKMLGEGTGVQRGFDTYYRCRGCHGSGVQ